MERKMCGDMNFDKKCLVLNGRHDLGAYAMKHDGKSVSSQKALLGRVNDCSRWRDRGNRRSKIQ